MSLTGYTDFTDKD